MKKQTVKDVQVGQKVVPSVSVVVNCFNGASFLKTALESLSAQTHKNWEAIIWDNRSTDTSASIVKTFEHDSRFRYFLAPEHTNLGTARRLAVEQCRGDYISFLDTDDIYHPKNLEHKILALQSKEYDVVYSGSIYITLEGKEIRRYKPRYCSGNNFEQMLYQFGVDVACMMIRRTALLKEGLNFSEDIYGSEEYDLLMQLAVEHPFFVINEPLAKVRIHKNSLTYHVMEHWATDRIKTLNKIILKHPYVIRKYPNAFKEAFARAEYYKARWLVQSGREKEAIQVLKNITNVHAKYRAVFFALRVSRVLWDIIHYILPSYRKY